MVRYNNDFIYFISYLTFYINKFYNYTLDLFYDKLYYSDDEENLSNYDEKLSDEETDNDWGYYIDIEKGKK